MEFYPHQQQQQQQQTAQQVESMATGSTTGSSTTNISTNNNNNNNNNFNNSSGSSCTPPPTSTADAATVAIAKDMLQLHHGGAVNNNTNNNNNINNAATDTMNTTNNNNTMIASSSNTPPAQCSSNAGPPENALGFLKFDNELLYITESCTIIGRNSSTSHVHFHVAENNLVSRKHFQVLYDNETRDFYVQCLSKNGIFVDDFLQRRNADPLKLPASCYFRFPSTEIRIQFESFVHGSNNSGSISSSGVVSSSYALNSNHVHSAGGGGGGASDLRGDRGGSAHVIISPAPPDDHHQQHSHSHHLQHSSASSISSTTSSHLLPMDSSNAIYSPLKISIPKKEQKSPYLSPTGTISAANSCPASPRQSYHQHQSNYNNYGNNNLQNQDLFQTPSTASYNHNEKPPYSYAQLIVQAISAAPDKQLTLSGIYSFIVKHYPYYRKETNKGWQNSIRHNLSLNRYFIKVARSQDEPGKGSFWRIDPDSGAKLIDHSYKKRRQRSSQGFRPPYGMPRSAPVSPSHMDYIADNSRESSPLQDIVLQSAPGSPGMSLENRAAESDIVYSSQSTAANNSHNQYNSGSPYYVTSNQSHSSETGGGNGVGALIALKRNHAMAAASANIGHHQQQQQQQQPLHPDIIYEDMSGNIESGDECDGVKRSKYISEVL